MFTFLKKMLQIALIVKVLLNQDKTRTSSLRSLLNLSIHPLAKVSEQTFSAPAPFSTIAAWRSVDPVV